MEFYRNNKKTIKLIRIYVGIFFLLVLMFLFGIGMFNDFVLKKLSAVSGIGVLTSAFMIIKMLISLKDTSAQLILSKEGITSKLTSVSKAAGLIHWKDITDLSLTKMEQSTLITLTIDKPDQYLSIMRKKLFSFAVNNVLKDDYGNLLISLKSPSLYVKDQELFAAITKYRDEIDNIHNYRIHRTKYMTTKKEVAFIYWQARVLF